MQLVENLKGQFILKAFSVLRPCYMTVLIKCAIGNLQSRLANERLPVSKVFHPFVCGPHNQTIRQLMEETGVKINVPPPSVMKDEIVISGEKEGVMKCKATIMAIFEEKVGDFTNLEVV